MYYTSKMMHSDSQKVLHNYHWNGYYKCRARFMRHQTLIQILLTIGIITTTHTYA